MAFALLSVGALYGQGHGSGPTKKDEGMTFLYKGKQILLVDLEGVFGGDLPECREIGKLLQAKDIPYSCWGSIGYGIGVPSEEYRNAMKAIFANKNGRKLFRQYLSQLDELEKQGG
jgi:hypothetical protein